MGVQPKKAGEKRNSLLSPQKGKVSEYLLSTFYVLSLMPGVLEESKERPSLEG